MLLLTGATGHVGKALLAELDDVLCLIRARDPQHLEERRAQLEAKVGGKVRAVAGDVSQPGLGVQPGGLEGVTRVLHSAASVRFDMPQEQAAEQNLAATRNVLSVCRRLQVERYDHISTCYVAGDRQGRVYEHECDEGQGFRNSYEWSKCHAEVLVRQAMDEGLAAAIHRPSIVVGDSRSGETESFNVLYWPLKLYARGWWRTFPGDLATTADVVPVDWLARSIAELSRDERALGGCFHLAAGDAAPTIGSLLERVQAITGGPPLRAVDPGRYRRFIRPLLWPVFQTRRGRAIKRGGDAFMPYFKGNPLFDTTEADALLSVPAPPVGDYIEGIVRFAVAQDFGGR
jgi:nucleoside-diphosphate-sugar epimerase